VIGTFWRQGWRADCPPRLFSWLAEKGSLTARCQRASREFRVRRLAFGKQRPLVGLPAAVRRAWVREVVLECDGVPVIFAHTTLSTAGNGRLTRWLARLGNRSLGSLLFFYPGFRRGDIEFSRLDGRDPLFRRAAVWAPGASHLWARRCDYLLGTQKVTVAEVFLPPVVTLETA
jgi:chorismate--pyruvate lyase